MSFGPETWAGACLTRTLVAGPLDARKARLVDVLEDVGLKSVEYLWEFGDGWENTVRIQCVTEAVPAMAYPRLIEVVGRCPPKMSVVLGYREFLKAIADPDHNDHDENVP